MKYPKFKVCVLCSTYNHSSFITDALNGFCTQQTDFPFVCCVVDDASTDGEQEVIRKYVEEYFAVNDSDISCQIETDYAHITFAQHKTNWNCFFAVLYLKENHYSNPALKGKKLQYLANWWENVEYQALCEGDDYWIDSGKLQKQFDLLEAHPEYSLCHHDFFIQKGEDFHLRKADVCAIQDLISIAQNNRVQTLTMFFRNIGEPIIPTNFPFKYPVYSRFMSLRLAEFGEIAYVDEPMAVRRVHPGGIFSMQKSRIKFTMSVENIVNMIDWYTKGTPRPDVVKVLKKRVKRFGIESVRLSIRQRRFLDAVFMLKWIVRVCL